MRSATVLTSLLAMLCAACETEPTRVETSTQTVQVVRQVAVPCLEPGQAKPLAPLPPVDVSKLSVDQKVAALAADALARDDYAKRAAALLEQCSKLPEVTTKGP